VKTPRFGPFVATLVAFFIVEIGDKTQVATVVLAARYQLWAAVVAGTTLGMLLANAPVVWLGDRIVRRVPLRAVHLASAAVFAVLGLAALPGAG
jgi:putative Ca2+/H+ antiporter (TMEM165/GDT1 family)